MLSEGTAIWSTKTPGRSNSYLAMQSDGNLVLYSNGAAYWATGMKGSGSYLVMQTDGNLVMYRPSGNSRIAVWSSGTAQATPPVIGGATGIGGGETPVPLPPGGGTASPPTTKVPLNPTNCVDRTMSFAEKTWTHTYYWVRFNYRYCYNGLRVTSYSVSKASFRVTDQALGFNWTIKNARFTIAPRYETWKGNRNGMVHFRVNADVEGCSECGGSSHEFEVKANASGAEWWRHSGG